MCEQVSFAYKETRLHTKETCKYILNKHDMIKVGDSYSIFEGTREKGKEKKRGDEGLQSLSLFPFFFFFLAYPQSPTKKGFEI